MFALFKGEAIKEKAVSLHPKHESVLFFFVLLFWLTFKKKLIKLLLMKDSDRS